MKFWDSSALVPLVVPEKSSAEVRAIAGQDTSMSVWWATRVECHAAIRRRAREGSVAPADVHAVTGGIDHVTSIASAVIPSENLRQVACELAGRHPLRAGDALQLAAAIDARRAQQGAFEFVSLDTRLREAAAREGFAVLPV